MNKLRKMAVALFVAIVCGCASVAPYYTAVSTGDIQTVDYDGPLVAEPVGDRSEEAIVSVRNAEGLVLVGRADFTVPTTESWVDAIVRHGRDIKAAKIDYQLKFAQTESVRCHDAPMIESYMMTSDTLLATRPCTVSYNEYHVYYFRTRQDSAKK